MGKRGFGGMPAEKRRAIAAKGGSAAHAKGKAHRWTSVDATNARRFGGRVSSKTPQQPLDDALATLEAYIETADVSRLKARRALRTVHWHLTLRDQAIDTVDKVVKRIRARGPVRIWR